MNGSGGAPISTLTLANLICSGERSDQGKRGEQATRQARMDRLQKDKEEESSKLLGAEARKRDVLLNAADHKEWGLYSC